MPQWLKKARISRVPAAVLCIFLLASFALADNYPRQPAIDIQDYLFKLELRDDTNRIEGETQVDVLFRDRRRFADFFSTWSANPRTARPA